MVETHKSVHRRRAKKSSEVERFAQLFISLDIYIVVHVCWIIRLSIKKEMTEFLFQFKRQAPHAWKTYMVKVPTSVFYKLILWHSLPGCGVKKFVGSSFWRIWGVPQTKYRVINQSPDSGLPIMLCVISPLPVKSYFRYSLVSNTEKPVFVAPVHSEETSPIDNPIVVYLLSVSLIWRQYHAFVWLPTAKNVAIMISPIEKGYS